MLAVVRRLGLAVLAAKTEVLVDPELAEAGVAGSENGETNDDTEREQFCRNLSQLSQALRHGVRALVLLGNREHHAPCGHHSQSSSSIHCVGLKGDFRRRWGVRC